MLARPKTCSRCSNLPDVPNVCTAELVVQKLHDLHLCSFDPVDIYRDDVCRHAVSNGQFQFEEKHVRVFAPE